jgi:hypothetical protein
VVRAHHDSGEILESPWVGGYNLALCGFGRGGDDQVVHASWAPLAPDGDQEFGMCACHGDVVIKNGDGSFEIFDELPP